MSAWVATGWALLSDQSVSVVPMIQCRPHGMTKSTLFSVRRMRPVLRVIRSRGTVMCTPLDARTVRPPSAPVIRRVSSVHTPVALITWRARTTISSPLSRSSTLAPVTRSPSRTSAVTRAPVATAAPYCAAVRASVMVKRASSTRASKYCTAPTSASGRRPGATASARRRLSWRWRGSTRLPSSTSYSVTPAPT